MKLIILTVAAALALVAGAPAETLNQDLHAWTAMITAANTELSRACDAVQANGLKAALPQMRHAITHIQALIDNQKTLIERGEALCLADPAYDHSKVSFWRQFEAQYVQLQKDMDGLNTEIEKKLAAIPIPGFYEPKTQSTREHPLV